MTRKLIIMGAAGRDFHVFNTCYRDDPDVEVVAFTATQIPNIEGRRYPGSLAGASYPDGIPIHSEEELPSLIREQGKSFHVFPMSNDLANQVRRADGLCRRLRTSAGREIPRCV